ESQLRPRWRDLALAPEYGPSLSGTAVGVSGRNGLLRRLSLPHLEPMALVFEHLAAHEGEVRRFERLGAGQVDVGVDRGGSGRHEEARPLDRVAAGRVLDGAPAQILRIGYVQPNVARTAEHDEPVLHARSDQHVHARGPGVD